MSSKRCCVPQCVEIEGSHRVLHWFPNPENDIARFRTWVHTIGGEILGLSNETIYKLRRVCHAHFEEKYCCRYNRISNIAVPTLFMPGKASVKCAKCGLTPSEDPSLSFHRFPPPSQHGPLKVWAKYCFPKDDWTSNESLQKLHAQQMMLCGKHFDDSSFTSSERKRLIEFAVPTETQTILAPLSDVPCSSTREAVEIEPISPEMSDPLLMETSPTPSPVLVCICCLQKEVPLVILRTCSHAEFLNNFKMPVIKPDHQVVCYQCHGMLKKIKLFSLQVEESFKLLSDSTTESTSKLSNQKQNLTVHTIFNIDLPQTSNIDNIKTTDNTEMSTAKSPQNTEKKTKNIKEALKIINGNQNNSNLDILATSLQCLSNTLFTDIYSEFQLNKTNSLPIKSLSSATHITPVLPEGLGRGIPINTHSSLVSLGSRPPPENQAINRHQPSCSTTNTTAISTGDEIVQNKRKIDCSNKKWYKVITEEDIYKYAIENQVPTDNFDEPHGDYSNLKQLKLSNEELMQERAKLAFLPGYARSRYRCKSCLIGFRYKDNLADHIKRKHIIKDKESFLKCKVCRQCVKRDEYDRHTFWHYNRYKCLTCGDQFGSYELAVLHTFKQHNKHPELKCQQCTYKTYNKRSLRYHSLRCMK